MGAPSRRKACRRARFGQGRVLAVLALVAALEPPGGGPGGYGCARCGCGWLRALSCPSLCASARRGRGRWGGGCLRRGLRGSGGVGRRRRWACTTRTDVHLAVVDDKEVTSVRATTLLSTILGMKHTRVEAVAFDERGVVADVTPTTTIPRCSGCFCRVDEGYDARQRYWRHLDLAG